MKSKNCIMNTKKVALFALAGCLVLALAGCKEEAENNPGVSDNPNPSPTAMDSVAPTQDPTAAGTDGSSVDFGLQVAPTPNFDSPSTNQSDKLYTIVGSYAYELDPQTLEPIGDPLDPITHEPVANPVLDGVDPTAPNNPQASPSPSAVPSAAPSTSPEPSTTPSPKPTGEGKLPNTGIFLEDD